MKAPVNGFCEVDLNKIGQCFTNNNTNKSSSKSVNKSNNKYSSSSVNSFNSSKKKCNPETENINKEHIKKAEEEYDRMVQLLDSNAKVSFNTPFAVANVNQVNMNQFDSGKFFFFGPAVASETEDQQLSSQLDTSSNSD